MTLNQVLRERLVAGVRGRAGVSLYGRYINRRLGGVLAGRAYELGLRPNQVTAASGVATGLAVSILVLVRPTLLSGVAVWLLVVLGYALDSADGQLARLRGGGTLSGEWFDHVLDAGRVVALHGGVLVMTFRFYEGRTAPVLALLYVLVATVLFAAGTLAEILLREHRGPRPGSDVAPGITLRGLMLLPLDLGVLALSFVLIADESAFTLVYGAFLGLSVVVGGALLAKWFRELCAVPAKTTT